MTIRRGSILALLALAFAASDAVPSSLVVGVQDRRLGVDLGVPELDPVGNSQTSVRATWTYDVSDALTLISQGGFASSYLELNDTRVSGTTDARFRALYRPRPDWALGAGTIVPFGVYELTAAEVTAAQWAWLPNGGFPLNRLGEGFGWELTAAKGFHLGPGATAGLAVAWLRHAEFKLLDPAVGGDYRLGTETSLSAATDFELSPAARLRIDGMYRLYGPDQLAGEDHVEQGDQGEVGMSLDAAGPWTGSAGVRFVFKSDNEFTGGEEDSVASFSQTPGTLILLDGRIGRAASEKVLLYLTGRVSLLSSTDYIQGDGTTYAFGPGIGWVASPAVRVGLQYNYIVGEADDIEGFDGHDVLFTLEVRP
jgi:hypothetical protein